MICIFFAVNTLLKKKTKAFIPFSIIQMIVGYGMCVTILIDPVMGSQFQHLARTTAPFQYTYGPLFYFFWVYMFRPEKKFRTIDFIHFLPCVLSIINFIPFYVLSAEQKLEIIKNNSLVHFTLIEVPYEFVIKFILFFIYGFTGLLSNKDALLTTLRRSSKRNKFIAKWMTLDLILKLMSMLAMFFNFTFFISARYFNASYFLYALDSIMNVFAIYLFPFILKGFRGTVISPITFNNDFATLYQDIEEKGITDNENELLRKLKDLLEIGHLFTDEDLTSRVLASKISCNESKLELLINKVYGLDAANLIDFYRVQYLLEMEKQDENFKNQNKETRSANAGFKTQVAMDAAMKKFMPSKS
jgi:hypothetical protein